MVEQQLLNHTAGSDGTGGYALAKLIAPTAGGGGGCSGGSVPSVSGTGGSNIAINTSDETKLFSATEYLGLERYQQAFCGSGGAGGGNYHNTGSAVSGNGGRGGGGLIIECGGYWNFTTAGGISVAGASGTNGTNTSATACGVMGGGGGGGGFCLVLYNYLTANSGTITVSGGTAGSNAYAGEPIVSVGGGGGGAGYADGSGGGYFYVNGVTGGPGNGGIGKSLVVKNTEFA